MDARTLLAGPRGRRLCLELAARLDDRISSGILQVSSALSTAPTVRALLLFGDGPGAGEEIPKPPPDTIEALAEELAALETGVLAEEMLHQALSASVEAAMYWQEPDGEDHLAALPEIREALLPLATAVVASPPAARWSDPLAAQQWKITWTEDGALEDDGVHRDVSRWARQARAAEADAAAARRRRPREHWSGAWWSIPLGLQQTVDRIPAALDLVEDELGWLEARATPVQGPERVYEILGPEDWVRLCREHPLEVTASRWDDWFQVTGREGRWVVPDWEQVAQRWDAVHLTVAGYLSSATQALQVDDDTASVIAGWDPGSTCWLTDAEPVALGTAQCWRRERHWESWARDPAAR